MHVACALFPSSKPSNNSLGCSAMQLAANRSMTVEIQILIEPGNLSGPGSNPCCELSNFLLENRKLCKKYHIIEQLYMCIQSFREDHIKFTCQG